ncbi:hypothetical protein LCGC14_1416880 [marine sediment metagenome]|uniref:Uracil-DNA glycosylase-like domain-containing protein n=1 Tax=marine sediment metagenome TaxID=412755 RepID=A0A0F9MUB4_9ZZZZ
MKTKTRKDKLVLLSRYLDLETNELITDKNPGNALYEKILLKKHLDKSINKCTRCKNLNIKSFTDSVPGWGNLDADIFFIGESPCTHSMIAQFPFAWKSGRILDIVLRLSNLTRYDVFISNSMHCHPESKRSPTDRERIKCSPFLYDELQIVEPELIVTLGNSAKVAMDTLKTPHKTIHKKHPASFLYSSTGLRDYILKLSLELDKVLK